MNAPKASVDFESRSACSLKRHGTWRYSIHPSTEILCLVFRLPHWAPGRTSVWHPAMPQLGLEERIEIDEVLELFDWIEGGGLVEAHNVWFEFCMWANIMVEKHQWCAVPLEQWRCSAAKAAAHALPRSLEGAGEALKLALTKDLEGSKVMKKLAKPRKSRKAERAKWEKEGITPPKYLWHESVELLDRLIAYCRIDVLSEEAISHVLDDLSPEETEMFLMDLRINARGFQIDKNAVKAALRLITQETIVLNQELTLLTDRQVRKATQRARMIVWFAENGLWLPDTKKATIDDLLSGKPFDPEFLGQEENNITLEQLDPKVRRALEIVRALGRTSTAKYKAMKDWMARNGRVYGGLLYHGASTGRWSGKGIQPHNFVKSTQKIDIDEIWKCLKRGHREEIVLLYRSVMEALANALRGAITAARGNQLYVADYAGIEARVLLWLAGEEEALEMFRQGLDIYCDMAESIYGYPCNKHDHPAERALGKVGVLGLGFQLGAGGFARACEVNPELKAKGIVVSEELAQQTVDAYRAKYWRVVALWKEQETAAMQAVRTGKRVFAGRMVWFVQGRFLYCQLPSGRKLAYAYPEVKLVEMPWGAQKDSLTFMAVHPKTHKWVRQKTYGGCLVENITQAVARDLMAYGMLQAEKSPDYSIVLSIHDELVAEAPRGVGTVHAFEQLMASLPDWAEGCPVTAEGWNGTRYRKG